MQPLRLIEVTTSRQLDSIKPYSAVCTIPLLA
jgi:hypothetical protein